MGDSEERLYEAESPDEAALVHAAHVYGFTLRGRSAHHVLVDLPGIGSLEVQLLHILPFDSNRKRMSVVVRHPLSGQVVVYTKGADSVIMDLSRNPKGKGWGLMGVVCWVCVSDDSSFLWLCSDVGQGQEFYSHIQEQTQKHLDSYAREGLRTLCIATKVPGETSALVQEGMVTSSRLHLCVHWQVLEEAEYQLWLKRHLSAESSIDHREELLQESAQSLETNLTLLGAADLFLFDL